MNNITLITTEQGGHQSTMKVPESCVCLDHGIYEGDTTVITVTLRPDEIMEAMRKRQDPKQLVLLKLHDAGAPVTGLEGNLSLKSGYLTRCDNLWNDTITFEWRSK